MGGGGRPLHANEWGVELGAQKALLELSKSVDKLNCWILVTLLCIGAAGAWEAAEEEAALALELWWASFSSSSSFTPAAHTVVRPWGVGLPLLIQSDFGHLRIAHWTLHTFLYKACVPCLVNDR